MKTRRATPRAMRCMQMCERIRGVRVFCSQTCWNTSGSYQRQNPVFCSDNTLTNASVDDQTRSMDSHEVQCEKGHTNDSVREDSWTEMQKRDSSTGKQVLARRLGANVNQLVQPWVTGFWLGRDTLSDEHLTGTAAGVMRSRAVRRLQEPARWVPAALNAMLFTPWSPHLSLPGRPRLQESCLGSLRYPQHQLQRIRSQK